MLAGVLTLCTMMISARGTGLGPETDRVLAATAVESWVTADVVGGQSVAIYWMAYAGVCASCLLTFAFSNAPFGPMMVCARVCSLVLG